jgi:NADH:ubiquinone oxidoreductase subunit 5 (subunit L)/multisubunit Na+/H+ antiporter MnhA subunit
MTSPFAVPALLPTALIVYVLAIAFTVATHRWARGCRWLAFGGSACASAVTTAAAVWVLGSGRPLAGVLFAHDASGLVVQYIVTPVSAWFLVVLGVVGIPVSLYSISYLAHAVRP